MSKVGFHASVLIADVVSTTFSIPKVPEAVVVLPENVNTRLTFSLYVPAGMPAIAPVIVDSSNCPLTVTGSSEEASITCTVVADVL